MAVMRGDIYIPLASRFTNLEDRVGKLERKVSILTWVVVIDVIVSIMTNPQGSVLFDFLRSLLVK